VQIQLRAAQRRGTSRGDDSWPGRGTSGGGEGDLVAAPSLGAEVGSAHVEVAGGVRLARGRSSGEVAQGRSPGERAHTCG
jgi:hypothetical protein